MTTARWTNKIPSLAGVLFLDLASIDSDDVAVADARHSYAAFWKDMAAHPKSVCFVSQPTEARKERVLRVLSLPESDVKLSHGDPPYCCCDGKKVCAYHDQLAGSIASVPGAPAQKPETVLQEAQRVIYGDRAKSYGKASVNHLNTALFCDAWVQARYGNEGTTVTDAYDVVAFNMGQKLARLAHALKTTGKIHRDSVVDLAGYAGNFEKIDKGE